MQFLNRFLVLNIKTYHMNLYRIRIWRRVRDTRWARTTVRICRLRRVRLHRDFIIKRLHRRWDLIRLSSETTSYRPSQEASFLISRTEDINQSIIE